jgi:hypothetical protein
MKKLCEYKANVMVDQWVRQRTCHTADYTIESVNFPDKSAFADTTDRRVAGKFPNSIQSLRQKKSARACAGSPSSRFATGMAAAYNAY